MSNFQQPPEEEVLPVNLESETQKKKYKKILIPIIVFIFLTLTVLSIHLFLNTDPEELVNEWITAVEAEDSTQAYQLLGKNEEIITLEDTKQLLSFYQVNPEAWQEQKNILQNSASELKKDKKKMNDNFGLITLSYEGKKWFILDEYKLNANLAAINVQSNQNEVKWFINDQPLDETSTNLLPGKYSVKAVYQNPYIEIKKEEEIVLFNMEEKQTDVVIDFDLAEIIVTSSEKDATVVINDIETELLTSEDEVSLGLLPIDGSVTTYVQKEYPWGIVKSDSQQIKEDGPIHFEFAVMPEEMQDQILEKSNELIEQQLLAITKQDASILEDITDEHRKFVDGIIKDQLNKQIRKEYILVETNYDLTSFTEPFYNSGEDRYEISINSTIETLETDYFQDLRVYDKLSKLFHYRFELYYDEEVKDWKFIKAVTQRYQPYDFTKSKTYTIRNEDELKDDLSSGNDEEEVESEE